MVLGASPSPSAALDERWAGLGRGGTVTVDSVELWRVELAFSDPVATARGVHRRRPLALVRVVGDSTGDTGPVEGWGECAALADTTFDDEDVDRSLGILGRELVPALLDQRPSGRCGLQGPTDLDGLRDVAPSSPLAFAALEMAVADAHLRAERRSLAGLLGVEGRSVEPGAVVGMADDVDQLLDQVGSLVGQGYSRVKVKIAPGWDVEPVSALAGAFPHLRLQVDANAAYRSGDGPGEDTGGHLAGLDRFGLLCIEQPFDPGDLGAHAHLAARLSTPICLDESLDSPSRVEEALALGACSVVCVKPARLGGLGAALSVIERCRRSGVPLWMGGMFESGYARGVNTTLGALEGMSWPGDLSSSRSYLGDDLVPDPGIATPGQRTRSDGSHTPPFRAVSRGPGMGPPPDPEALARFGTLHQVIRGQ
jgi:O-succinylbenzoate synthase